jgi:hypothetical protein
MCKYYFIEFYANYLVLINLSARIRDKRCSYRIFVGKYKEEMPHERSRHRCESVDWIHATKKSHKWRAFAEKK